MRRIVFYLLLLTTTSISRSNTPPASNAIALGLANFNVTSINAFAVQNNSALLSKVPSSISITGSNLYGVVAYNQVGASYNYSQNGNGIGVLLNQQTGNLNQQMVILAAGKQLAPNFSAGVSTNFYRFSSTNAYYRNRLAAAFSLGFFYSFEDIHLGCNIQNPLSTRITDTPIEDIPSSANFGIGYTASDFLTLNAQLEQIENTPTRLNLSAVLSYDEWLIRGGLNTNQQFGLGGGYKKEKLQVDIGMGIHAILGLSPALNITYAF